MSSSAETNALYEQIVEEAGTGVWVLDQQATTTFVNRAMANLLGHDPQRIVGKGLFEFVEPVSILRARRDLELCRKGELTHLEVLLRTRDGESMWAVMSVNQLRDADGNRAGALAMVTELSELREKEARVRFLAEHDPLTGLFNRQRLLAELDRRLELAAQHRACGSLLTLDLDNFTVANDLYGHATGDKMLIAVAEVFHARLRAGDVAARIGNDDFAVLLPDTATDDALALAHGIRALLRERNVGPPVLASIGVAPFQAGERVTAQDIMIRADVARHQAANAGGDQARVYAHDTAGALTTLQRIRAGIAEERLILCGQPIVNLRTGLVTHHELLVRMLSADGELIPPGAFLPTAERYGLIGSIDRWVTRTGLRLAQTGVAVSINLSGYTIGDTEIIADVRRAIADGLPPARLIFEVTETAALTNVEAAREFAERLNRLGCSLALDDFGARFGSFTYLKHVPARYLKIDQEFVKELVGNPTDQEVVKSIVGIARSLGKLTIAEGVEDGETLALLRCYGVDAAQGFHLGRPERILSSVSQQHAALLRTARIRKAEFATVAAAQVIRPTPRRDHDAGPRVLVAEDNEVNQLAAIRLLEKCGYRVDLVETGHRAVEMSRHGDYVAILMDCQLPGLSGYDAAEEIRRREQDGRRTPIIGVTAGITDTDRARCLAAGMDEYIAKPLRSATLKQVLARLLPSQPTPFAGAAMIDPAVLAGLADDEPHMAQDVVALFREESRRAIKGLRQAVTEGNLRAVDQIAGRLKGGSTNVGATRITSICDHACELAASGEGAGLHRLHSELVAAFEQTETLLEHELGRIAA